VAGLIEMVSRENDRTTDGSFFGHDLEDPFLAGQIQPGDRLVQQDERCLPGQGLGHHHPLALAGR
ncbi:uncharacterized protein METZ01_LOCUS124184, partial [marine metagenome]